MIAGRLLSRTLVSLCVAGVLLSVWSSPALAQRKHVFGFAFASAGAGDGQLERPGAVVVNEATGDVYVLDRGNGRVEIFSASGAYVGQFDGSAAPTGAFSWAEEEEYGESKGEIAVDNSKSPGDPSAGDVYVWDGGHGVIDKFSASGAYIGQLTGLSPTRLFSERGARSIAVDPNDGSLWVQVPAPQAEYESIVQFNDAVANEYTSNFIEPRFPYLEGSVTALGRAGFAFDAEDHFLVEAEEFGSGRQLPAKVGKAGELLIEAFGSEVTSGLAVDLSSGDVYADDGTSVAGFSPTGQQIEQFGSGKLSGSEGVAVNSATGTVYAANTSGGEIDAFTALTVPDSSTGGVSHYGETSVTVEGTADPDGLPVTACVFEYGTSASYGHSVPCAQTPAQIGSGDGSVAVSAELTGLERLTAYHFRLKVSNAGGFDVGRDGTFTTPEPVGITEVGVADVAADSALFSVLIDPGGSETTYRVEYGTSVAYGESVPVPAGVLGPQTSPVPASVRVEELTPETTYHARVVASNALGTVYGPEETFTTQPSGAAFALPDGRQWELVSPPDKYGATVEALGVEKFGVVEAAEDGGAISYSAGGPVVAEPAGNPAPASTVQVLSRRGADGWTSEDMSTPHTTPTGIEESQEYQLFSSDLSQDLVQPKGKTPLSPEATGETPYLRENADDKYVPLVTAHNVPPGTKFGEDLGGEYAVWVRDATPDLSHTILEAWALLTPNAIPSPYGEIGNIFEWSGGQLQLVNVLPDGAPIAGAYFGAGFEDMRNAISDDGSRVLWTGVANHTPSYVGPLYMRDTVTGRTVEVDSPAPGVSPSLAGRGRFQIAAADGSKVFFTDEQPLTPDSKLTPVPEEERAGPADLYVYETATGALTDLSVDPHAGEQAEVKNMVTGASEDGSVVYFVAKGVLASGAQAGGDNLYVESETDGTWSTRLVAVLAKGDHFDWGRVTAEEEREETDVDSLTAQVSPNGRYLAFMSELPLTGYDNRDASSGQPDEEVFLYDEETGRLRCASCDPTGARPDGLYTGSEQVLMDPSYVWYERWIAATIPGWTQSRYQSRYLSNEGRLFFNSSDALVPQATNGKADVYEYEPQGVGSCVREGGCVALISAGTSAEESTFMDASANGDDVFFRTASSLVAQDYDTAFDVYDAHVCSAGEPCVSAPVSPPPCTSGDSCKAPPMLQPAIFGAPASATFSGAGNVPPAAPVQSAKKKRKRAAKSGHRARKAKKRPRQRGRRARRARKSARRTGR
jgi:hypothetical protein